MQPSRLTSRLRSTSRQTLQSRKLYTLDGGTIAQGPRHFTIRITCSRVTSAALSRSLPNNKQLYLDVLYPQKDNPLIKGGTKTPILLLSKSQAIPVRRLLTKQSANTPNTPRNGGLQVSPQCFLHPPPRFPTYTSYRRRRHVWLFLVLIHHVR